MKVTPPTTPWLRQARWAVRLAAELGLRIDPEVEELIREGDELLDRVSEERIRDEISKILLLPGASRHLRKLDTLGLLERILPELTGLEGISEARAELRDPYLHSLAVMDGLEGALSGEVAVLVPFGERISAHRQSELSSGRPQRKLQPLNRSPL